MLRIMSSPSQPVSFRLSAEAHRRLSLKAAGQGVPVGEYVRDLVLDKLDEPAKTQSSVEELRDEVAHLKRLLASGVEAILRSYVAKRPPTEERIRHWVNARFRAPRPSSSDELDEPDL